MAIDVSSNADLQFKILSGVNKLGDTVTSTLGPGGRNVLIKDQHGVIKITKDGVSVSRAFTQLKDPVEDTAMQVLKTVAEQAVSTSGDGTTTATLLAQSIIVEGFKAIQGNSNPIQVKSGIDKAVAAVLDELKKISFDITTQDEITQVAKLSANGDEFIAKVIAEALDYVGEDGAVSIEESKSSETTLSKVEGIVFDRGFKTPYFVTDYSRMEANLSNPYILIVDGVINTNEEIVPILEWVVKKDRSILVIGVDVDNEALSTLIVNKQRGSVKVCAVKAPDFGDRRTLILEDIAVATGATVISQKKGLRLKGLKSIENYLGECRIATITGTDTTIVEGKYKSDKEEDGFEEDGVTQKYKEVSLVEKRLVELKSQYDNAKSNFERENLQSRLSRLTGGVAVINVGAISEVEMNEKKDRIDDALHATKAAIMEGVVPGAGMALINCLSVLDSGNFPGLDKDQLIGLEIVRKTLYAPFKKILSNAGVENHNSVLASIANVTNNTDGELWSGYNVKTGEYGSLKQMGVFDPTKVTRSALENAASVAGIILTTTAAVYEIPEKKETPQPENQYQ